MSVVGLLLYLQKNFVFQDLGVKTKYNYTTSSENPKYNLVLMRKGDFDKAFNSLGYTFKRSTNNSEYLTEINIILSKTVEPNSQIIGGTTGEVYQSASYSYDLDSGKLKIRMYFSDQILDRIAKDDKKRLNSSILSYLCQASDNLKSEEDIKKCNITTNDLVNNNDSSYFVLKEKSKLLNLHLNLVGEVYAQSCTGGMDCCQQSTTGTCVGHTAYDGDCSWPGDSYCGPGDVYPDCSYSTSNQRMETVACVSGGNGSCYVPSACSTGAFFPCGGAACLWVQPPPTTPAPPPPPPPGSGGALGCTFTGWSVAAACGGSCAPTQKLYTAQYSPAGCSAYQVCNHESVCDVNTTPITPPPPPPSCIFNGYTAAPTCGTGGCAAGERLYTGNYTPAGCTASSTCNAESSCYTSCTMTLKPISLDGTGDTDTGLVLAVNPPSCPISNVTFASANGTVASAAPGPDSAAAYQTAIVATGVGTTSYTATATTTQGISFIATAPIVVGNPPAWFQTIDGDAISLGSINDPIPATCLGPCLAYMNIDPPPNHPGLAIGRGSITTGAGRVSAPNLQVPNSQPDPGIVIDTYDFYFNRINSPLIQNITEPVLDQWVVDNRIRPFPTYRGYHLVHIPCTAGTAHTGNFDMLNLRTILYIDCNLSVEGDTTVTPGQGTIVTVVQGDIDVAPTVTEVGGIYSCDGTFHTGTNTPVSTDPPNDDPLHVKGTVACEDVELERDLEDNSQTPAEVFEYQPDQTMQFPSFLSKKNLIWREVAP